ncbi:hypothetical protein HGRIS_012565 [Hohenbuehelia grisea]|uniref:Beta-lactamase-related domain-containing protein n=1 Tax=Hohenbuehelia grisea TaxID=104357 RepID=A0ABR3ISP2_9AGAR
MHIPLRLFVSGGSLSSLSILLANAQGATNTSTQILTPEVDAFINGILSGWNSAGGVGVAVVRQTASGEWQIETKGYGTAKADGTNVTENTLFAIGSNSKLFTSIATGLLISNESITPRLSWDTKIASVIPDWELMDPIASAGASIIDTMSHRTGLPRHDLMYKLNDSVPDLIKRLRFLRNSTEFRDRFQYCNLGYGVLSYLPTAVLPDHPPFGRYVKAHIFDPLGLNSTTYAFEVANATGNLADGFQREVSNVTAGPLDRGIPHAIPYWSQFGGEDGNSVSGPGGIISNAVDMATWLQSLLLGGANPSTNVSVIPATVINTVATGFSVLSGSAYVMPSS